MCLLVIGWGSAWGFTTTFSYENGNWTYDHRSNTANNTISVSPLTMVLNSGSAGVVSYYGQLNGEETNKMKFQITSSFTLSCANGVITKIVYTIDNKNRNFTPSTGTVSNIVENDGVITGTWEAGNETTSSVKLTNSTNNNINVFSIVVTYKLNSWCGWRNKVKTDGLVANDNIGTFIVREISSTGTALSADAMRNYTISPALYSSGLSNTGHTIRVASNYSEYGPINFTFAFNGNDDYLPSEFSDVVYLGTYLEYAPRDNKRLYTYVNATGYLTRINTVSHPATDPATNGYTYANDDRNRITITSDNENVIVGNGVTIGSSSTLVNAWLLPKGPGTANIRLSFSHLNIDGDGKYVTGNVSYEGNDYYTVNVLKCPTKLSWSSESYSIPYSDRANASLPTLNKEMLGWISSYNNNGWGATPTYTVKYKSSVPEVASVDENTGAVNLLHAGTTVITAYVVTEVNGVEWYEYSEASYTLTIEGTAGPRIVWVTAYDKWDNEPDIVELPRHANNLINKKEGQARAIHGPMKGATPYAAYFTKSKMADSNTAVEGKEVVERIDNIFSRYGQNIMVNAYALAPNATIPSWWKRMPTDNDKPDIESYYYVEDDNSIYDGEETYLTLDGKEPYNVKTTDGWKKYKEDWRPVNYPDRSNLFYKGDAENNTIEYSNSAGFAGSKKKASHSNTHGGGAYYYELSLTSILADSLEIYAKVFPDNAGENAATSTVKIAVLGGYLQMSFEPKSVVVNEGNWIQPYVKFPDSPLEDFQKIYVTLADGTIATVTDMDKLFENLNGSEINSWTTDQVNALCGDYITWKWGERNCQQDENGKDIEGTGERYVVITGVRPKIWGITAGQETDVTVHIVSDKWTDTGATCHVKVIAEGGDLFHFEMNDVNGSDVASMDNIGDIYMFQGDYIYMPGIVGNPNGNDEYSAQYAYKYLYAIKGDESGIRRIVLNRDPYFYGEGVPNYYIAETDNGEPLIPTDNMAADDCNMKVLIFKEIGLGNYYRNDSLMLYGNKPGAMYLYAEDAQTGWRCKPLRIHVIPREGTGQEYGKASLMAQKQEMMKNMSYPFTWDFEHMNLEKIYKDASFKEVTNGQGAKIAKGNGGSYWRKLWDYTSRGTKTQDPKNTNWYQWNGVFNADHDDKDGNGDNSEDVTVDGNTAKSGLRQRWFKDITANGEYLSLFKGLMVNIAGLDYWQQKYHRFRVNQKGTSIIFVGGVHFMSLPGFGATGNVGETYTTVDPTRPAGTVRMPNLHNQMNTNDNVTFESDFGTNFTGSGYTATLTDEQKRNNKVKFVIKARGGSNPVSETEAGGVIYVGGKSMISTMINDNGVRFSAHTDKDPETGEVIKGTRIPLFEETKTYVVELDPWSDEYQEQIYLAMDGTVEIFWMGITTEPRNMRSDHNVFTYSYPKDIDMEKTNEVTKLLTNDIVNGGVELKTYYGDAFGGDKMTLKPIANTKTNYKFGAYEGVFVYPSVDLNQLRNAGTFTQSALNNSNVKGNVMYHWSSQKQLPVNSGVTDVPVSTTAVTIDIEEKKDEKGNVVRDDNGDPVYVAKTDPNGHYAYKQTPQEYTYSYLPIYFVANAENQDNYNANNPSVQDDIRRGREHTMDAVLRTSDGYDHWVDMPATPQKYTDGLWYNQRRNKLNGNPYSRWQPQDYVSETDSIDKDYYTGKITEGVYNGKEEWGEKEINGKMVPRWITLNMTNKFMIRYLKYEENEQQEKVITKVLDEFLKDAKGDVVSAVGSTATGDPEWYYNLVGPSCVRFYRTFVPNYPKGRRASLSLTWDQYNTNTFGKEEMYWNVDGSDRYANFPWVDYEKAKPLGQPSGGTGSAGNLVVSPSNAKQGLQMVFLLSGDGESMVSEDAGIPDSINGVEESIDSTGDGVFYNLNGTRVTTPRKGVYIYNGRKVVIK